MLSGIKAAIRVLLFLSLKRGGQGHNILLSMKQMSGSSLHICAGSTRIPFEGPTLMRIILSARKDLADRVRWISAHQNCKIFCSLP